MANYINNEILSEAYSHLEIDLINDPEKLEEIKREISHFIQQRASFLFGEDVRIEIEFAEGSLRTKIKVMGSVVGIITSAAIAYGGFRQAMEYLSKDATLIAESANLEMIYRTKTAHCDRVAIEKRRGIFGRANELLGVLDTIERAVRDADLPTTARALKAFNGDIDRLSEWQMRAEKLLGKLQDDSSKACVAAGILEELEHFPDTAPWAKRFQGSSFRAELIKSDPQLAGKIAGSVKQFEETVKYIKKYYETIVRQNAPKNA